jgi:4-hydroxy-tetrahydrodipicolinate synthase
MKEKNSPMTQHPLSGVYAAALTPLKADSTPDLESVPALLAFLAERGCHGALIFGTTGEGPSFSPEERRAVWSAALKIRETHPDFRLLAGTGTPSLQETIDLTKSAFDLGYDGVVVLPPYYYRTASDDGLFLWFESLIHKAVPSDGYLLGYHFPQVAGIGFSMDLLRAAERYLSCPVCGHQRFFARPRSGKRAGCDLWRGPGRLHRHRFISFNGFTKQRAGCITAPANLLSPGLRAIYDAFLQDEDLSKMQACITEQRLILEKYTPFPPALKALLSKKYAFPRWPVRPPLVETAGELVEQAVRELEECEWKKSSRRREHFQSI